jgi:hypothetical protein
LAVAVAAVFALVLAGAPVATAGAVAAGHGAAVASGIWGTAEEVPGTGRLNAGRNAAVSSVSCPTPGNCSAVGYYTDAAAHQQAFVVTQASGIWGTAEEVPGSAHLNAGGAAELNSVSCAAAGDCSAGGFYRDRAGHVQAFVVTQANGIWGTAEEVPGTARLNSGGQTAGVSSVSCATPGNCSAGGWYTASDGSRPAFVVTQANGIWGTAKKVLNAGGFAAVSSVSCTSPGNCSAGGYYDGDSSQQAFVVTQANGIWGTAKEVPGTARLNRNGLAAVSSVSCGAAGNCSAGGYYAPGIGTLPFAVSQANGTWGTAKEVPGTAVAGGSGGEDGVDSVSCAAAGDCSAGGDDNNAAGNQAFVVTQTNGIWGTAEEVPGTASLNTGGGARVTSVSCTTPGNCSAGGSYNAAGNQAFVVTQANGIWGTAEEVPGTASLNTSGDAQITSVSCAAAGKCSAGGYYDGSGYQAFVVTER